MGFSLIITLTSSFAEQLVEIHKGKSIMGVMFRRMFPKLISSIAENVKSIYGINDILKLSWNYFVKTELFDEVIPDFVTISAIYKEYRWLWKRKYKRKFFISSPLTNSRLKCLLSIILTDQWFILPWTFGPYHMDEKYELYKMVNRVTDS